MHETLDTQLRYPTVKCAEIKTQSETLGTHLMAAYALRVHADYKPEQDFPPAYAEAAIDKVRAIIEATESAITQDR